MKRLLFFLLLIPSVAFGGQFSAVIQQYNATGSGGWSCTDADLLCESLDLETAGNYDNTATEVGTGGTVNADAAHSGTFVCPDKGSEALQITKTNTGNNILYTYFDTGASNTFYTQMYFYLASENINNGDDIELALLSINTTMSTICWRVRLTQSSGNLVLQLVHYDGTSWRTNVSGASISTGSWFGVRVYYSYNTGSGGIDWMIDYNMDGSFTDQSVSNDGTTTRQGRYLAIGNATAKAFAITFQADNIKADSTAFASACN